jgi:hypothetical protein
MLNILVFDLYSTLLKKKTVVVELGKSLLRAANGIFFDENFTTVKIVGVNHSLE